MTAESYLGNLLKRIIVQLIKLTYNKYFEKINIKFKK